MRANTKVNHLKSALTQQVISGRFQAGERLPSVRDLAKDFGVSPLTASMALGELSASGMVDIKPGKGAFVSSQKSETAPKLVIGLAELMEDNSGFPEYAKNPHPHFSHYAAGFNGFFPNQRAILRLLEYPKWGLAQTGSAVQSAVMGKEINGLIVPGWIEPAEIDFVAEHRIPLVLCNHLVPERSVPKILINLLSGFRSLISQLGRHNHRHIEMITYSEEHVTRQEQGRGYVAAAQSLGLHDFGPDNIHVINNVRGLPREEYDRVVALAMAKKPTAIVAFDEVIANRVVRFCFDQGLAIPKDLSLVAMNDLAPSSHPFSLTALNIQVALQDMIYEACGILDRCIRGEVLSNERVMIGVSVIEGESVGPAKEN